MSSKSMDAPILMYHSISDANSAKFHPFTVPPELFAEHMAYLCHHGYTPLTVTQYVQARAGEGSALPERPVVLTFDDGFADFFTAALPVLCRYNFPATLYVSTAFVGGTCRWLRHEREKRRSMLTWEQVVQIDRSGIECGGHSHTHPQLDTMQESEARDEIVRCKDILQHHLGHPVVSFAYPFGYYTAAVQRLVFLADYTSACAVQHSMNSSHTHSLALTRFMVTSETTVDRFGRLLAGTGLSAAELHYLRARTLVWSALRRSSACITREFQGRGVAR
jgi:peptidoglycan/xylan/chitin deacetylase (PgdA/CDA1 family)